jgi:inorganic pyrophosphatase
MIVPYRRDLWFGVLLQAKETRNMQIESIAVGYNPPVDINVVVEIPMGGEPIKYELDKRSGRLFVDRFLYTPVTYPGNYGFVPNTLSLDNDPIDVLVCSSHSLLPGSVVNCRPIGVLKMEDDGGQDEKIVAVPSDRVSAQYSQIKSILDLPEIRTQQIEYFFEHYKDLETHKWVKVIGWGDFAEAMELVSNSIDRFGLRFAATTLGDTELDNGTERHSVEPAELEIANFRRTSN